MICETIQRFNESTLDAHGDDKFWNMDVPAWDRGLLELMMGRVRGPTAIYCS